MATVRPLLTRDPITNRYICSFCWNMQHDMCSHPDCDCLHWTATDAGPRLVVEEDDDSETEHDDGEEYA